MMEIDTIICEEGVDNDDVNNCCIGSKSENEKDADEEEIRKILQEIMIKYNICVPY